MKKHILTHFFLLFFVINVNAQIKKGAFLIGGEMALQFYQIAGDSARLTELGRPFSARFQPEIGCFVTNKVAIGARLGVQFGNQIYDFSNLQFRNSLFSYAEKYYTVSLNPFFRYYFNPNKALKIFYQLNVTAQTYNAQRTQLTSTKTNTEKWVTYHRFRVDNSLGINYFMTQNVAIESTINYTYFEQLEAKSGNYASFKYFLPRLVLNPEIKMRLFLNSDKMSPKILAEKYLKKGNTTYGLMGNLSFSNLYINISPSMGYFLTDKLLVGSSLDISFQNNVAFYGGISPEMRFYQPITKDVQIVLRGATSGGIDFDLSDKKTSPRYRVSYLQFQGGLNKFIAENISVQALVGVNLSEYKNELLFNPNIKFGLQYFMDKQLKIK